MSSIFVGFAVTDAMRESFANCSKKNLIYLENSDYLEFVNIDGCEYVGKNVKSAIAADRLEDTARSVVSLLTRVSEDWSQPAIEAIIIAAEDKEPEPVPVESPEKSDDNFDYMKLVD
jgi:hypothetical protein